MINNTAEQLPVVEEFGSLQGEGFHTGEAVWFIRLGGCDTGCPWCDTAYAREVGSAQMMSVSDIVSHAVQSGIGRVVITGGEPSMHSLEALTEALHKEGVAILLETSGTHTLRGSFDWICLSPKKVKAPQADVFARADELKIVVAADDDLLWAEECAAKVRMECRLFLQPEWGARTKALPMIVEYIKRNPRWRLSLQTHKYINIR